MYEEELLDESFWPGDVYVTTPEADAAKIKQYLHPQLKLMSLHSSGLIPLNIIIQLYIHIKGRRD